MMKYVKALTRTAWQCCPLLAPQVRQRFVRPAADVMLLLMLLLLMHDLLLLAVPLLMLMAPL